jgi:ADP-ribosylglycohydrolase
MQESNNNIQAFNTQVRKLLNMHYANKRQAFNETVLLNSLAKAYFRCKDEELVLNIKRKWSDHQDGTRALTSTNIMELALKQYQTSNENSSWGVNSKQVKSIMNVTSQITQLKKWRIDKSKSDDGKRD